MVSKKVQLLRDEMEKRSLDAYIVFSSDPHQCEYLPTHYKTREYISEFTGSAGTVLVTKSAAILWTDGRYFLQAAEELKDTGIELYKMRIPGVPTLEEYLAQNTSAGSRIGMDGAVVSVAHYKSLKNALPHAEFVTDEDLVSLTWKDRPAPYHSKAFVFPEKYAGVSAKDKIARVRKKLEEKKCDATVIGALEDVCYLFNIRAHDIAYNPFLTGYAIIDSTRAQLFADDSSLDAEVKAHLEKQGVSILPYEKIFDEVSSLSGTVYIDPSRTNIQVKNCLNAKIIEGLNITSQMKAIKNNVELEGFREAMVKDGVALMKIYQWIEENIDSGITECDVSDKLAGFRAEREGYVDLSFGTIAGYAGNGAIIHYAPQPETCATLKRKGLFLLDSGGHYFDGSTDTTRTIALGELSEEEKIDYTLVLKAHIALATAKVPEGTTGHALDAITRAPIWRHQKDYKHGTGHGVGHVLGVHEGPQSISTAWLKTPMQAGMVTSNEPGMYIAGSHGVRIESLIVAHKEETNDFGSFLGFETITVIPIDTKPLVREMMTEDEINWLNDYNAFVREKLIDRLDEKHKKLLIALTEKF